eukprot:363990_1
MWRLSKLLNHFDGRKYDDVCHTQGVNGSNSEGFTHQPLARINVNSEDGELKEVMFGRIDDFILPKYSPRYDYAHPKVIDLVKKYPNTLFSEADPEWYKQLKQEMENIVQFLQSKGIIVYRPESHSKQQWDDFALIDKFNTNVYCR